MVQRGGGTRAELVVLPLPSQVWYSLIQSCPRPPADAAFAAAVVLSLMALITLVVKEQLESKATAEIQK